jgi:hypothetical protein
MTEERFLERLRQWGDEVGVEVAAISHRDGRYTVELRLHKHSPVFGRTSEVSRDRAAEYVINVLARLGVNVR